MSNAPNVIASGGPNVIASEGDLVFDVEGGDAGPFPAVSRRSQNAYQLTAAGDIIFRTGGVERGRLKANGAVTGIFAVGQEIGYDQITANVNITGLAIGTATTAIAGSSHTFDGAPVIAEFFSPQIVAPEVANGFIAVSLFEGATCIGDLGTLGSVSATSLTFASMLARYRFTPSAGAHTYSVKAYVNSTTGTPNIGAGASGTDIVVAAYLRFTKV